jgi:hypothetical protein
VEVQRCQIHKRRNVKEYLPENCQKDYDRRMRNAYAMNNYAEAKEALQKIFRQLERINPSAARSLEEGLEETLTVHRLSIGTVLRRKLATTNPIESCLSTVQRVRATKALERRRSAAVLDRHRTLGSREKVPTHQGISRNPFAEGTSESVAPSAEGGSDTGSCLNLVAGRLTVPNIESRFNQLKLGHPLANCRAANQFSIYTLVYRSLNPCYDCLDPWSSPQ